MDFLSSGRTWLDPYNCVSNEQLSCTGTRKASLWSSWYRHVLDVADRLPVVVRFPAGPQVSLKVVTSRKAPGTDHKKQSCTGTRMVRKFGKS